MGEIISDIEWSDFVNHNIVSDDVIEVLAIRIVYQHIQTDREIAIYKEHSKKIEKKIKELNLE